MDLDRLLQHITHGEQGSVRDFSLALRGLVGRSMDPAENLADVPDKKAARDNLGLGALAERSTVTADLLDPADLGNVNARLGTFSTVADVQNSHIPPVLESIRTEGYNSPGDGGEALYVRVENEPDHWGKVQSADGQWWEKASRSVGTFALEDFLHPQDLAAARQADIDSQDESRVTAAVQAFHDRVMEWWIGGNWRLARVIYPTATLAINDEMFSEDFAEKLWSFPHGDNKWLIYSPHCAFRAKNWTSRAAVRTSGLYKQEGITYPVPKAMFRWERQFPGGQAITIVGGRLIFRGEGSIATDPIGVKVLSVTGAFLDRIQCNQFQNTQVHFENLFNGGVSDLIANGGGYQPTEFGGSGFLPRSVRFSNVGPVVTASEPVFNEDHVGRWFGLDAAGESIFHRRNVFLSTIASVDSATQITLTDTPNRNATNQTGTFAALRASTTAGSNVVTLSASIDDDMTGRYVTVVGAGIDGYKPMQGLLTAVVLSHSGDTLELSAAARYSVTGAPFVGNPHVFIGHTAEALKNNPDLGDFDDMTLHNAQIEAGSWHFGAVPFIWSASTVRCTITGGSKVHGHAADKQNNFGGNFANVILDGPGGYFEGNFTHGGYDPEFGQIIVTGDRTSFTLKGDVTEYPSSNRRSRYYIAPCSSSGDVRIVDGLYQELEWKQDQVLLRLGEHGSSATLLSTASSLFPGHDVTKTAFVPLTYLGPTHITNLSVDELTFSGNSGGIYGWGVSSGLPSVSAMDDEMRSGLYHADGNTSGRPGSGWGILEVQVAQQGERVVQIFTTTGGDAPGAQWQRVKTADGWTPWRMLARIARGATLPSAGDTTGACFFLTTDNKPYWWDGTQWVDATGNPA